MCFLISFLVGFIMMQFFFYDLSSLGSFYSLVLTKLFSLLLVGLCTFCMYTLCSRSVFCFNIFIFKRWWKYQYWYRRYISIIIIIIIIIIKDYR